jgi:two-component system, cell cycle response regulator
MRSLPLEVLLVEDHEPDAFTVTRFGEQLNRNEWQRSGQAALTLHRSTRLSEALDALKQRHFDVVLLDLTLPDSFALHTLKAATAQAPETPIVILTGSDDDDLAARAVAEGAQDYLSKSDLSPAALWRALRFALERQRLVNALRSATFLDAQTGLYSRNGFLQLAEGFLEAAADAGRGAALLLVELANLASLAQRRGRADADLAVLDFAEVLRSAARKPNLLGRLEENLFAMLTPRAAEPQLRLQASLDEYYLRRKPEETLQVRTGIAQGENGIEELILQARIHLRARAQARA